MPEIHWCTYVDITSNGMSKYFMSLNIFAFSARTLSRLSEYWSWQLPYGGKVIGSFVTIDCVHSGNVVRYETNDVVNDLKRVSYRFRNAVHPLRAVVNTTYARLELGYESAGNVLNEF